MTKHPSDANGKLRYFRLPGYALFLVMVFLPVTANILYACLIGLVLLVILFGRLFGNSRLKIHPVVSSWVLFYVVLGGAYVTYGLLTDAPGALFSCLVYVIYPVVYLVFIGGATAAEMWTPLFRIVVVATIAIGLCTLEFALWTLHLIPDSLYFPPLVVDGMTINGGAITMHHSSLSSLVFAVPFLMALLAMGKSTYPLKKGFLWLALLLGTSCVLVGGRRALVMVVVAAPFFIWFFRGQLPSHARPTFKNPRVGTAIFAVVAVLGVGVGLSAVLGLTWHGVQQLILEGFDPRLGYFGAEERWNQFYALMHGWISHPLFGNGLGSFTPEVVRSYRPWEYELQYVMLLFQTGLVGVALYSLGIVWIFWTGIRLIRSGSPAGIQMVPVLVGTSCFLLANAVEPYLQTFCQQWTLFLPVGLINSALLCQESAVRNGSLPQAGERVAAGLWGPMTVLAKRKVLLLRFVGAAVTLAVLISFLLPKTYTATTKLLPPSQNKPVATNPALLGLKILKARMRGDLRLPSPNYLYIAMLRSRSVEDGLIDRFSLTTAYKKTRERARELLDANTDVFEENGMIYISVRDRDPQRAAALANGYVEELQQLSATVQYADASKREAYFEHEKNKAAQDLAVADQALKLAQESTGIVNLNSQTLGLLRTLAHLQAQIAAKEVEAAEMQSFASPESPELIRIQNELVALRDQLARLQHTRSNGLFVGLSLEDLPRDELEFVRKLRDREYQEATYQTLARQYEAARVDKSVAAFLVPPLERAVPPETYSWPLPRVIALVTMFLASVIAIAVAILWDIWERAPDLESRLLRWQVLRRLLLSWRAAPSRHEPGCV